MNTDDSVSHGSTDELKPRITNEIIGAFFDVHNELGSGFVENVYAGALDIALRDRGLTVAREVPLTVRFRTQVVGSYRADFVIEHRVLVEVKAVRMIETAHRVQVLNYLRATRLELALLCNFGSRVAFERVLLTNDRKGSRHAR